MGTLANSADPDEVLHNAAFHQGLHCLPRQNPSSVKEIQFFCDIITCDPSIITMDYPDVTVSNFMGNSISLKRVSKPENILVEALHTWVQIRIVCALKIAIISLSINLNMCCGYSKEQSL